MWPLFSIFNKREKQKQLLMHWTLFLISNIICLMFKNYTFFPSSHIFFHLGFKFQLEIHLFLCFHTWTLCSTLIFELRFESSTFHAQWIFIFFHSHNIVWQFWIIFRAFVEYAIISYTYYTTHSLKSLK